EAEPGQPVERGAIFALIFDIAVGAAEDAQRFARHAVVCRFNDEAVLFGERQSLPLFELPGAHREDFSGTPLDGREQRLGTLPYLATLETMDGTHEVLVFRTHLHREQRTFSAQGRHIDAGTDRQLYERILGGRSAHDILSRVLLDFRFAA